MDRVVDLVESRFRSLVGPEQWHTWSPSMLRRGVDYRRESALTTGLDTAFVFEWEGEERVLRPDAAVDGLREALRIPDKGTLRAVLGVYAAHRNLQGACTPLNRDRAIWPVMQVNAIAPVSRSDELRGGILRAMDEVFDALRIPTVRVEHGPWKAYARARIDWVLAARGVTPTVMAMAYEVGDHYRSLAGVPNDAAAWDVGLTGRPIRILWELAASASRCVLPVAVTPFHAVVGERAARYAADLPESIRTLVVADHDRNWWQPWFERGVPVLVGATNGGRRSLAGIGRWESRAASIPDLLRAATLASPSLVLETPVDGGPGFEALCAGCATAHPLAAPVTPRRDAWCETCGSPGEIRLTAPTDQVY